jgi:transcriptional regulator with XRE-family HTH domain
LEKLRDAYVNRFRENQTTMAKALGITQSAVSQLLSGKNSPGPDTAKALGEILGFDYRELLAPPNDRVASTELGTGERLRPRQEWQHLVDPALEQLIREGYSADESRRALDATLVFRKRSDITVTDLVRFARALISEERQDSGKHRRSKHV